MIKANTIKALKLFDAAAADEKELCYRNKLIMAKEEGREVINEAAMKRVLRNAFVG